eukprot:TRINITY_DN2930_c0_g1_i1.p1 TRINITY_DN2930_c0_g1~~TRINITY_DN2930_c0_g1_i1.p1  ORF type:complete len:529 (-),score=163.18 TRINITY_DN2930_c0_g1_i1:36-1622(-)
MEMNTNTNTSKHRRNHRASKVDAEAWKRFLNIKGSVLGVKKWNIDEKKKNMEMEMSINMIEEETETTHSSDDSDWSFLSATLTESCVEDEEHEIPKVPAFLDIFQPKPDPPTDPIEHKIASHPAPTSAPNILYPSPSGSFSGLAARQRRMETPHLRIGTKSFEKSTSNSVTSSNNSSPLRNTTLIASAGVLCGSGESSGGVVKTGIFEGEIKARAPLVVRKDRKILNVEASPSPSPIKTHSDIRNEVKETKTEEILLENSKSAKTDSKEIKTEEILMENSKYVKTDPKDIKIEEMPVDNATVLTNTKIETKEVKMEEVSGNGKPTSKSEPKESRGEESVDTSTTKPTKVNLATEPNSMKDNKTQNRSKHVTKEDFIFNGVSLDNISDSLSIDELQEIQQKIYNRQTEIFQQQLSLQQEQDKLLMYQYLLMKRQTTLLIPKSFEHALSARNEEPFLKLKNLTNHYRRSQDYYLKQQELLEQQQFQQQFLEQSLRHNKLEIPVEGIKTMKYIQKRQKRTPLVVDNNNPLI